MTALTAINSGDTAWVLTCSALVLFMTPGLAFFYAGHGAKPKLFGDAPGVTLIPLGVVSLAWAVFGYSLAFGNDAAGCFVGNLAAFSSTRI